MMKRDNPHIDSECEGCKSCQTINSRHRSLVIPLGSCGIKLIPRISERKQCPCMTCIIKGMCQEACGDLIKYAQSMEDN